MRNSLKLGGVLCVLITLLAPADLHAEGVGYARAVNLMEVTSESAPGETYRLGGLLNLQGQVVGYFYDNAYRGDGKATRQTYSLMDAVAGVTIEERRSGNQTFALMRLKVSPVSGQTARVVLDYLKNGIFNTRAQLNLGFRSNPAASQYFIYDPSSSRVLQQAKIFVNRVGRKEVGISKIEVR